ncbi:cysteine-rich motor neuron 1 protein-like isoform X2 [Rana temporaria]|uniref:cysteine-rich motor neuron 1 protein-like isoform X2 n=1 Tax=Rana temporaria TaxID=8407 RepID=UPI001AADAFFB|nr:cysteine-rich motor neuron 1 protein-like isoform X2 [Rana temporaria]
MIQSSFIFQTEIPGERSKAYMEDDDENCPQRSGCYRAMGTCDCVTKHTCILDFDMAQYTPLYCDRQYDYLKRLCANVTCPEVKVPTCPPDSVLTKPHTPYGECCPTIPSYCTCHFERCVNNCPNGKRKVTIWKTKGEPGSCCDLNLCLL